MFRPLPPHILTVGITNKFLVFLKVLLATSSFFEHKCYPEKGKVKVILGIREDWEENTNSEDSIHWIYFFHLPDREERCKYGMCVPAHADEVGVYVKLFVLSWWVLTSFSLFTWRSEISFWEYKCIWTCTSKSRHLWNSWCTCSTVLGLMLLVAVIGLTKLLVSPWYFVKPVCEKLENISPD